MHQHHDCEHDLNHCGKCDVAYCVKCSKEWGANSTYTPLDTITTVTDGASDLTLTGAVTITCSHAN